MMEFDLIARYFTRRGVSRGDTVVGVGDDCAVLSIPAGQQLAVTSDTLVSGVHFHPDMPPQAIGHKALAVSLSDLAAMGAEPAWVTLALTLPSPDETWVEQFSAGLFSLAEFYGVEVTGGDTTSGPLSITITAHGLLPEGRAVRRCGAKAGDALYVTGTLGDAAAGLQLIKEGRAPLGEHEKYLINRLCYPTARILAGQMLRNVASSCMDLSDGLASDLRHICHASGVGAVVSLDQLPLSSHLKAIVTTPAAAEQLALAGGDDYELLFTVAEEQRGALETTLAHCGVAYCQIGYITGSTADKGISYQRDGKPVTVQAQGFEHFRTTDETVGKNNNMSEA